MDIKIFTIGLPAKCDRREARGLEHRPGLGGVDGGRRWEGVGPLVRGAGGLPRHPGEGGAQGRGRTAGQTDREWTR